ncbi:saposin [Anopheles sinensis]|uniref:Saposin n=1 Tax=Anopheles sinensis TaxID=74873 RepID=A0A084VFR7_ANOSI|nr:saposin [Anopheles sinensis]
MENRVLAVASILLLATAAVVSSPVKQPTSSTNKHLLGAKECTWGPSYWCSDIRNAKSCGAVSHCIQTVWEKQQYPVDNDEICNICLDMVKQARDQLESNETQADLKAVFEGSCNLIPVKVVKKECRKLADDFIPELVEALASQMNPNVVCSVAGLCNNAAIDKLLAEQQPATKKPTAETAEDEEEAATALQDDVFTCEECGSIAGHIVDRFRASDRDRVLEGFLRLCGQMSSYSDGCSSIVLTYFGDLYGHLNRHLTADAVCHLSGVCSARFHQHDDDDKGEIEVRPMGGVGVLPVAGAAGDDIPCKLCEQLVDHLRDVLVANTTELEFKQVLEGLCKQTHAFADECNSLVEQYYSQIYETLVHNLDSNGACFMIGVCPKGNAPALGGPIMPLLPTAVAEQHELEQKEQQHERRPLLGENEPVLSAVEIQQAQLPIDRLMGAPSSMQLVENGKFCTICEYFMHFVQEALSEPANEDEIKQAVSGTCNRLPASIRAECRSFVDVYGDAVIALLIQSMDPRQVCPTMHLCPAANDDIEVFAPTQVVQEAVTIEAHATATGNDKPTCPLCLFAVSQLEESVKTDRSKDNIKSALSKLCTHLSPKLRLECTDFVDTYTAELVEMLASDFTPQEICVFLKLCVDQRPDLSLLGMELDYYDKHQQPKKQPKLPETPSGDIETNEIPDITVNGQITIDHTPMVSTPECLVCEEMVKEVEKRIKNKKSKEQIKDALEHACDRLRKYRTKCEKYIDQHSDQIIDLMLRELSPKEICHTLGFCLAKDVVDELEVDEALLDYVVEPPAIVEPPKELGSGSPIVAPTSTATVNGLEKNQPPQCAICEFVMVKLEADLANKKTQEEIENTVRSVCSRLPNTVAKQCSKLIDQYGQFIIKFLQTLPPEQICTKLDLCEKELEMLEKSELEIEECGVCQGAVAALDALMGSEQLQQEHIAKNVDRICNELPAQYYDQCDKLLSVYGISMLHQLQKSVAREQVCLNIDMCSEMMLTEDPVVASSREFVSLESDESVTDSAGRKTAFLLGSNRCSWGPVYWCNSEEAAEECKSKDYCKERKLGLWQQ